MGKDHTNIQKGEYEMLGGKCADDFKGEDYKEILKGNAPSIDMTNPPVVTGAKVYGKSKKEK